MSHLYTNGLVPREIVYPAQIATLPQQKLVEGCEIEAGAKDQHEEQ